MTLISNSARLVAIIQKEREACDAGACSAGFLSAAAAAVQGLVLSDPSITSRDIASARSSSTNLTGGMGGSDDLFAGAIDIAERREQEQNIPEA